MRSRGEEIEIVRDLMRDAARAAAIEAPTDKNYSGFDEKDAQSIAAKVVASFSDEDIGFALARPAEEARATEWVAVERDRVRKNKQDADADAMLAERNKDSKDNENDD